MKKAIALFAVAGAASFACADVINSWDLSGRAGDEAAIAGVPGVANVSSIDMTRGAGLTANVGGNSFNSAGFTQEATDYVSFGFSVDAGFTVDLTTLTIAGRSSNSGPGSMGLYYSGDGFTAPLFTLTMVGTAFTNAIVDLSSLSGLTGAVEFRLRQIGTVSANGGTTGSTGTFRVAEYFDGTNFFDVAFEGTITPAPGALALLGLGGLAATRRRRD